MAKNKQLVFSILWPLLVHVITCSLPPGKLPSSGVPCYLHPSQDECHYKLKPGSNACTTAADRKKLNQGILVVNRTLTSLEQQLIRLGVIPPNDACSELPDVENGGVIYSDLNLGYGATGRYICNEGYTLISFQNRHVFTCTEDGIWDGNVTHVPIKCLLSADRCDFPDEIMNGTITYTDNDTANVMVGDVITYECMPGTTLQGPVERFCLKSGNWSESAPQCIVAQDSNKGANKDSGLNTGGIIGASVGSVVGVVLIVAVVSIVIAAVLCGFRAVRKRKHGLLSESLNINEENEADGREENKVKKKPESKKIYGSVTYSWDE